MLPTIQEILFSYLEKERNARELREAMLPEGSLFASASSAGGCARAVAFRVAGTKPEPLTPDSLVNFYIGDSVHDVVQRAIIARWPDAETEKGGLIDDFLVGHSDLLYRAEDEELVLCEIKTTADFGFELATGLKLKSNGRWSAKANPKVTPKPAEGPKKEHLLQAGIYAIMHKAKYIAIVYVRKTAAKDEPIIHEWRFKAEDVTPAAETEIERLKMIVTAVRAGQLPPREYNGQIIDDPGKERWPCGYCSYKTACIASGAGIVPLTPRA